MSKKILVLAILLSLGVASTASAVPNTGASFGILCGYSHSSFADPVMEPSYREAMLHDFYGSETTNQGSDGGTLRGTEHTCGWEDNSSSYWHPRVQWVEDATGERHHLISGQHTAIYYKTGHIDGKGHRRVEPFPAGFQMLAGGEGAHLAASEAQLRYTCKGTAGRKTKLPPKTCKATQGRAEPMLEVSMRTPECWSGVRSKGNYNMYNKPPTVGVCPPSHPVQVPEIAYFFNLTIPKEAQSATKAGSVEVHMGRDIGWKGPRAFHSDYINGWRQSTLEENVKKCIRQVPKAEERPSECRDPRNFS